MFKSILIITILPTISMAHVNKCPHTHHSDGSITWECNGEGLSTTPKKIFTATGRICSGSTFDQNGDLVTSRRHQAEQLADQTASKHCYPFQYKRESEYQYRGTNEECLSTNPNAVRETVTAEYSCASL